MREQKTSTLKREVKERLSAERELIEEIKGPINDPNDKIKTYVFVDVSNIRNGCIVSLKMNIDFLKFLFYLQNKFPMLEEVRYYEGVSMDDKEKLEYLQLLESNGYIIRALKRRPFVEEARYGIMTCGHCHKRNRVQLSPEKKGFKSNVDIHLTVDMLECAVNAKEAVHVILASGDGDYTEAIHAFYRIAPKGSKITIMAPPRRLEIHDNSLSKRLRKLTRQYDDTKYAICSLADMMGVIGEPLNKDQKHRIIRMHQKKNKKA